jgi:hypothetical protein
LLIAGRLPYYRPSRLVMRALIPFAHFGRTFGRSNPKPQLRSIASAEVLVSRTGSFFPFDFGLQFVSGFGLGEGLAAFPTLIG